MVNKVCMPSDLPTLFSLQRVRIVTKARISPLEGESWFYTHEAGGGFKALDAHLGAGVLCIGCCKLRDGQIWRKQVVNKAGAAKEGSHH
eukprot:CAMPEP_0181213534 /NCGR_PEP_ID=MMETSP1096-20121128/24956_1 /TAXON_ID=156174 ORGANISM="Chrysochromulina ericina, Strain CCMP281" /NCGR_SAMPLE_ID=MMETSP1096 /ASSEMBLY_ACC=CAM_ASM_000453 /LENGTH=88 /DNA_ID=CAMNT_0023305179 /DNA_START=235 /DNA_END=501 /DNA_ORIENTATION=+